MNKQELVKKISETLQIPQNKSDYAFHNFLKKLGEYLKDNEALKIPELGVFQLKKEPVVRGESVPKAVKDIIVFIPFTKAGAKKDSSLFLHFNIPTESSTGLEVEQNAFTPSVDNPLIPIGEDVKHEEIEDNSALETKIEELIKNSEKLEDFEIWKEYPRVVDEEQTDEIDDLSGIDIRKSGIVDIDLEEEIKEPEKENVDWNWSEDIEEELLEEEIAPDEATGEVTAIPEIDEEKLEKKMKEISKEPSEETAGEDELTPQELEEDTQIEEEADKDNTEDVQEGSSDEEEEDPFKILENTIIEEPDEVSDEEIDKIINDEEPHDEEQAAVTEEPLPKAEAAPLNKEEIVENDGKEEKGFFAKYKNYFLIAGLLIILYWLFAPGNDEPVKEFVKEDSTQQQVVNEDKGEVVASFDEGSAEEKKVQEKQSADEKKKDEIEIKKNEAIKANRAKLQNAKDLTVDKKISQRSSNVRTDGKFTEIKNERNVGNNIFYDGNQYMIQISSWRNNYVAQREAEKLIKKGYDAFVVKAYVSKFKATFYRVRIGGFSSKQEALNFAKKNL